MRTASALLAALDAIGADRRLSRTKFFKATNDALDAKLSAPEKKLPQKHIGERNDEAEICKVKGAIEPSPDRRDNENVPLGRAAPR